MVYSVLYCKVKNTPLKDTDGKGKFKKMHSFLLVDKGRLFFTKLTFEEFEIHEIFITGSMPHTNNKIYLYDRILYSIAKGYIKLRKE